MDGAFEEAQEFTADGEATVLYRAGTEPGPMTLRAYVDDAVLQIQITHSPIGIILINPPTQTDFHDRAPLELRVSVTSSGGEVSPEAEIGWFATVGPMKETERLLSPDGEGVAEVAARWHFERLTPRPRVDFVATRGRGRTQHRMQWRYVASAPIPRTADTLHFAPRDEGCAGAVAELAPESPIAPSSSRVATVEPLMIAGDMTEDGTVAVELADGTIENIPVKATATYRVEGLQPGERVSVRLGVLVGGSRGRAEVTAVREEGPIAAGVRLLHVGEVEPEDEAVGRA